MYNTLAYCDVTVAIAVKDRLDDLREAVTSVFTQTVLPREVIIVDDFSIIPLTFDQVPACPPGVSFKIIRNATNLGAAISLNLAVEESRSPFVAFLDSDDCHLPTYLEKVSAAWSKASPDIACVCTGVLACTDRLVPYRKHLPPTLTHEALLAEGNVVGGHSSFSVRREAFLSVGGYPACRGAYDWGVLLRLTKVGRMQVIPETLVLYRSPSTNPKPTYTKSFRKQILAIAYLYRQQSKRRTGYHEARGKTLCTS